MTPPGRRDRRRPGCRSRARTPVAGGSPAPPRNARRPSPWPTERLSPVAHPHRQGGPAAQPMAHGTPDCSAHGPRNARLLSPWPTERPAFTAAVPADPGTPGVPSGGWTGPRTASWIAWRATSRTSGKHWRLVRWSERGAFLARCDAGPTRHRADATPPEPGRTRRRADAPPGRRGGLRGAALPLSPTGGPRWRGSRRGRIARGPAPASRSSP